MKKRIFISVAIIFFVLVAIVTIIIKEINKKNDIARFKVEAKLNIYMNPLRMRGEFEVEKDKVTVTSIEQNETRVKYEVILFNTYYPDYATTYDELMDAFYSYCDNPREIELLEIYNSGIDNVYEKMNDLRYPDYKEEIINYLEEINVDYETASEEQIEEACKKVAEDLYNTYK